MSDFIDRKPKSCHFFFLIVSEPRPVRIVQIDGSGSNATAAVQMKSLFTQEIIIYANTRVLLGTPRKALLTQEINVYTTLTLVRKHTYCRSRLQEERQRSDWQVKEAKRPNDRGSGTPPCSRSGIN